MGIASSPEVGRSIADARAAKGLSLEDLSSITRLRQGILAAVESGDLAAFGGDTYARGHLRVIAGVLDLDPDALVRDYEAAL